VTTRNRPIGNHPEISRRSNGDRLVGDAGPFAEDLYRAGTPPMHGFAAKHSIAPRVADIRIGDKLIVERQGKTWVALDDEGVVGHLRWSPGDDGRTAPDGTVLRFSATGTLHVRRLLIGPDGAVKDIGGDVSPS
jgi:hypothetical protein